MVDVLIRENMYLVASAGAVRYCLAPAAGVVLLVQRKLRHDGLNANQQQVPARRQAGLRASANDAVRDDNVKEKTKKKGKSGQQVRSCGSRNRRQEAPRSR